MTETEVEAEILEAAKAVVEDVEIEEPHGRGAWTTFGHANGSIYYAHIDGTPIDGTQTPDDEADVPYPWWKCVRKGVEAIQILLNDLGHSCPISGEFDVGTKSAAQVFQMEHGLPSGGYMGPVSLPVLVRPFLISAATRYSIHPKWLHGIISKESQYDLGAQGWDHWQDMGGPQFNTESTSVSPDEAFAPKAAINRLARRLTASREKFSGKGLALRTDCMLAEWNAPTWADSWYAKGEPPNDQIAGYVELVKDYASKW